MPCVAPNTCASCSENGILRAQCGPEKVAVITKEGKYLKFAVCSDNLLIQNFKRAF